MEIAEQVNADALVHAGDLDPPDKGDPLLLCCRRGLGPASSSVVVGQCNDVQTGLDCRGDDLGRRLPAITGRGVGVKVDAHGPRLGQPRLPRSNCPAGQGNLSVHPSVMEGMTMTGAAHEAF